AESQALLNRIPLIEARDIVVRLTWNGNAMLDLVVDESLGATVEHFSRRSVFGGALVKEGTASDREAVYVCPRAFNGEYPIHVKPVYNDKDKPAHVATVEVVTHEGTSDEKVTITKVSVAKPEPVKFTLTGGRRTQVLPYEKPHTINAPNPEFEKPKDS